MTEDEAKSKPCFKTYAPPAVGMPDPQLPGHMLGVRDGGFQMRCLGSGCPAWRWEQETNQPALMDWARGDMNEHAPPALRQSATVGFCGVAGKP